MYLGNDLQVAFPTYRNIDNISASFNGVTTSFPLLVNGVAPVPQPLNEFQCLISVNGVVQKPDPSGASGFKLSGGNIVFSAAPGTGQSFFGVILAGADYVNVGANFPSGTQSVPSITFDSDLDTGIYNSGANQISFTTAGTERLRIDSVGQIESVSLGTAAAPAFSWTTDTDTGIYSPGANQVAISTNGSGRLFVDASGNVGIKNAAPGNYNSVFSAVIGSTSSANNGLVVGTSNTGSAWIGFNDTGASEIPGYIKYNHSTDSLEFQVNSAERMRLDSSGRLGLGTSSPTTTFDCRGVISTNDAIYCYNSARDGLGIWYNPGGAGVNQLTARVNGADRLTIDSSGRVGIGVTGPESALDVSGDVKTSGSLLTKTTGQALAIVANPSLVNNTARIELYGTASAFPKEVVIRGDKTIFTLANASEVARIDSSGRLGLGTNSPSELLHVSGGRGRFASGANFLDVYHNGTAGVLETTGGANTPILFATTGLERGRIDTSGRLLVGTSTARANFFNSTETSAFQVEGTNVGTAAGSIVRNSADTAGAVLHLAKSRGAALNSNTLVSSGDDVGAIAFSGNDGTEFVPLAYVIGQVDGTPGANDMPGRIVFFTTADGASSPTERMRITSGGGVKITTTGGYVAGTNNQAHEIIQNSNSFAAVNAYHTAASGTGYGYYFKFTQQNPNDTTSYVLASFDNTNANIYTIWSNGTVTARSDVKFKKNIETTRDGYLEDLSQLRVVKYNWINHEDGAPKELGFIAQEVEQVFPGLVDTQLDKDSEGNETGDVSKSIKTSVFIPMLVKALQEAHQRIETLEAKVAALEAA